MRERSYNVTKSTNFDHNVKMLSNYEAVEIYFEQF